MCCLDGEVGQTVYFKMKESTNGKIVPVGVKVKPDIVCENYGVRSCIKGE